MKLTKISKFIRNYNSKFMAGEKTSFKFAINHKFLFFWFYVGVIDSDWRSIVSNRNRENFFIGKFDI